MGLRPLTLALPLRGVPLPVVEGRRPFPLGGKVARSAG